MKSIIASICYKGKSDIDWTDIGMVPGTGKLSIDTTDSEKGRIRTYKLEAVLYRELRHGRLALHKDMRLLVVYDDGARIPIGTLDMPVRLDVSDGDVLAISCNWQKSL